MIYSTMYEPIPKKQSSSSRSLGKKFHHRGTSLPVVKFNELYEQTIDPKIALVLNKRGNECFKNGNYEEALTNYKDSLIDLVAIHGLENKIVAKTLGNIGNIYWRLGNSKGAIKYLRKSLQSLRALSSSSSDATNNKILPDETIDIAKTHHSLGILYFLQNQHEKALWAFNEALSLRTEVFGVNSIDVARTIDAIGSVYLKIGECSLAIRCFLDSLRKKEHLYKPNHFSVVMSKKILAKAYKNKEEYGMALVLYDQILSVQLSDRATFDDNEIEETMQAIREIVSITGVVSNFGVVYMNAINNYNKSRPISE